MTDITSRLADLSPERRKLLALKLKQKAAAAQAGAGEPGDGPAEHPASFAQRRLWLIERLQPGSPAYNMPGALRFRGPIDAAALERAVSELVRRHQTLRTRLESREGEPVQIVLPHSVWKLETGDLTHLLPDQAEAELSRIAREDAVRAFRMEEEPLFRAVLVRVAEDDHALLWTVHHAMSDGWSNGVLVRDLSALYGAFARGEESPLQPLALQYGQHAARERERLSGEALERRLAFWRQALAGAPPLLELPTDRPRTPNPSGAGDTHDFALGEGAGARVEALARETGATPFMVLLSAFQAVLARWSGQDDVVVGTPVANRPSPELEPLVGFFANTLALRGDLSGDPSFRQLLGRVRAATLGAFEHQDLPFEKLVEELHPERSLSHAPVFQVAFSLQNAGSAATAGAAPEAEGGVTVGGVERRRPTARFDLLLNMAQRGDALLGLVEYATDLFDAATVERLVRHFATLLDAALASPDAPVSALLAAPAEEAARIVAEWSGSPAEYPRVPVHRLFQEQAARTPDAVALRLDSGETVSYAELNARANRVARRLRALGVGIESRVGVSMERSAELIAALLGILKAGGAYVPLDPAYPPARLDFMRRDAGVEIVIAADPASIQAWSGDARIVGVDADAGDAVESESTDDLDLQVDAESLAYVIYTSGSTGQPKGTAVPHRAVVRLVRGQEYAGFGSDEVFLQLAPVAFDASTFEVWGALLNGGSLAIYPNAIPDPASLGEFVRRNEVTTAWLTAGLFHQVVDAGAEGFGGLRQLLAGGDVLSPAHVARAMDLLPDTRLIDGYGPTEATTFTCCHLIRREDAAGSIPIGRPLANARVYVLDAAMRPVPAGTPGELFVGGDGVARGYLGRPGMTAEKFVADPFSADGGRLYRTGDRVRWNERGELEFLGRIDQQVKLRGFRIEPGEIESVLRSLAGVCDAVVVLRGEGEARRLAAYVVAAEGSAASPAELKAEMASRLPDYMVPAAIAVIDAIPITPNGKVDRAALPEPEVEAAGYVAPRTATEEVLAAAWADLLGVEKVGATDGFFDLGGHSLLATRLVSRVRETFGAEVPLRALFESPVLGDFAARVDEAVRARDGAAAAPPPLVPAPRDGDLPLSFGQERLWLMDRLSAGALAYNVAVPLFFAEEVEPAIVARALSALVERHEALRTTFRAGASAPQQVIHPPFAVDLSVRDVRAMAEEEQRAAVRSAVREAMAARFDLERGPLLRAVLVRGTGASVLVLSVHHAVFDGWSVAVLERELRALADAFARGADAHLPPLAVQYADWAAWQRRWMDEGGLDAQVEFWRRALDGAPATLDLPADRPRPAARSYAGAQRRFHLPAEVVEPARALARREGATLFMVLMAAYDVLLGRLAGTQDVVVGTQVAGRTRGETEGLIGFFVNNLPMRADLSGDPTFRELLARVRRTALDAYAHQDVPFQRLVDEIGVARGLSHTPVFQATLVLQTTGFDAAPTAGEGDAGAAPVLASEPVERAAQFELTFDLHEAGAGIVGAATYSTELFDHDTAAGFVERYRRLLAAFVSAPETRISAPALADDAEQRTVLATWNATEADVPRAPFHRLFEAQVAQAPDAPALRFAGETLTYAELNARANRLARHLAVLGVGAESVVAVSLGRSAEMVIALLAVNKAGGAFLPVDPAYPAERRRWMLEDSAARVVLTHSSLAADLPPSSAAVVAIDRIAGEIEREDDANLAIDVDPENAAYLIFTSGSTGRPKGVVVPHRGVGNLAEAQRDAFAVDPSSRVLQFASFSFDAAVAEIAHALLNGACLVMAGDDERGGAELLRLLTNEAVSVATLPPSLLAALPDVDLPALRTLVSAGEAVGAEVVARWGAGRRFVNAYGPTETTVCATVSVAPAADAKPPIGRPIANARTYVLDAAMQPVPAGVAGELYIGGVGVARGYVGRAAATAAAFVPDPFSAEPGARLYRTGDRVRWLRGGEIEFIGRVDEQVKVRGFRVETGEIEAALRHHPAVRDVAVDVRGAESNRRLVAYVVAAEDELSPVDLKAHAALRLPEHMVPSAIVLIDRLPLSPSGKVDRRALPEPDFGAEGAYVAPRTPTEEMLAAVWSELLGVDRVGAEDGFFALGGHSLLATRLVSRVREAFGAEVPLRAVFEAPTLAAFALRVDAALRADPASAVPPLVPVARGEDPPLSYGQERLWVMDRLSAGALAYSVPNVLPFAPDADGEVLARALSEVVRRHEVLRTVFRATERGPVQSVHPASPVDLPADDLRHLPVGEQLFAARAAIAAEAARPFDLERGPLLRARLLRTADAALVVAVVHHAVFDGWSMPVLEREMRALADAFARGEASPLPDLPVQYADWAAWQRRWMEAGALAEQIDYWRAHLAGAPEVLELPADRPRPAVRTHAGARRFLRIPAPLVSRARALARGEGATLFMVLLAAYDVVLGRLAGTEDVVVGTQVAGRTRGEVEGLIGFFVNNLPLRADLSGDPTFRELIGRVKRAALDGFAHQDVPFQTLVDALGVERSLGHPPVFQAAMVLQTTGFSAAPVEAEDEDGAPAIVGGPEPRAAQYELSLDLHEVGGGITGTAVYSTEIFDHHTAERLVADFLRLLEALVAAPDARISAPAAAEEAELRALAAWNATDRDLSTEPVHRRFEAQVARTPFAPAVVDADGARWTYAELNARANRLARRIRALGAGPEARVAVMMERSAEMVAALYAALKSGAAYVPVDPGYPAERVAHMLGDAAASIVLTHSSLADRVDASDARVIAIDTEDLSGEDDADLSIDVHPESLAYAIYTSGSTGLPKGAGIPHRALANHMAWMQDAFPLGADDRVLQKTPFSFDASVWEFHAPLIAGATLVMASPDAHREPAVLLAEMREHGVTILQVVPTLLRVLLDEPALAEAATLRRLFAGGEALAPDLVRRLNDVLPSVQAVNLYGPTETCIDATAHVASAEEDRATVPIGRPVHNTRAYVLDGRMRPVAPGVPGELFIAGAQVGRGYLGRPALTAAAFVPDPFSGVEGARLYRTGDRARWRKDGVLEFLGRIDQQVKVRGFRIEPGEVEAALRAIDGVRDAVVIARTDPPASARLVAYVVAAEGTKVDAADLRSKLADRLPAHMVPSAFVSIGRIPLTPGGKVDRRALPAPAAESAQVAGDDAPRTPVETALAAVWAGVLGADAVGIHDNFFALGGDSILAIQVVSRAARAGWRVTARQIFQHQTVAELARHAEPVSRAADAESQAPVVGAAPLTPIQHAFLARDVADAHHWNQAQVRAASAPIDAAALERAVAAVLEHHDALRLRFARGADGAWAQSFDAPGAPAPVEVVDLTAFAGDALSRAIVEHASRVQASLDLAHGPLTRMVVYRGGAGEPDRLLWIAHHLVVDAVSWGILLEDLEAAYALALAGDAVHLPPKTTSYRRWAERLAELAATEEMRGEAAWWLAKPWERAAPLPAGAAAGEGTEGDARSVAMELDEETTRALLQEVPPVYGTQVNDALMAALARALGRWTGGRAVAVELEGHGREELFSDVDLTRTVGWFTSAFPVLLEAEAEDAGALLRAAKERLREVPARGVGFGVLRWLADDALVRARLGAIPWPEVSFNYLGQLGAGSASAEDAWLSGAREGAGPVFSARARRTSTVHVLASVRGGRLRVVWVYPGRRWDAATLERVAADYEAALREMVAHCRAASGGYTPSDFPLAGLDQAALNRVLAEAGAGARGSVEDVYPLTPLQEGMLFHALGDESGAALYHQEMHLPVRIALDEEAMARAWAALVERTPVLRSAFVWRGVERPLQVVLRGAGLEVARHDLRGLDADALRARLEALRAADRARGFAPERAPLMRVALVRTGERAWEMLWSFHHLLLDGWSMPRLMEDLGALYSAFASGGEPAARARRPFRDYVAWLEARDRGAARAFWTRHLAGFEGAAPLFGRADAARAPRVFGEEVASLPPAVGERLRERAGEAGLTPTTLYQGALAVLLARFSGEADVAFGNTVSGRPAELEGVEEMVGMMINTVPVRVRVPTAGDAGAWLRALQAEQAESRQHDHVPLVEVRRWAGIDAGRELFDTLFVYENYPMPKAPAGRSADDSRSGSASPTERRDEGARRMETVERTNYPLALAVAPTAEGVKVRLTYDAERHDRATALRLLDGYRAILARLVDGGVAAVADLDPLDADERGVVLDAWNATALDLPAERTMPALLARRAAETPDAVAAEAGDARLSYIELDAAAGRVAAYLRALGVGPEMRVSVAMERGIEVPVAVLGVLKAGAAYVPVDPAYPADRIEWMLTDSRAPVVLSQARVADRLPSTGARVIAIDGEWKRISALEPVSIDADPAGAAYVIYTSGSTGTPKGVVVPHAALLNHAAGAVSAYGLTGGDRVLQFASLSFDASVEEIFGAWAAGAALVTRPDELAGGLDFSRLIEERAVTVADLPTAFWHEWVRDLDEAGARVPPTLRLCIIGGEKARPDAAAAWSRIAPGVPLLNSYGPTETTVTATAHRLRSDFDAAAELPIGRPMPNVRAYVLDAAMRPAPVGVPGELFVGGRGVARGYLDRPSLTAERFVPDPFSAESGSRLYRTGDRARWSAAGQLEFLGRVDAQVKVRGFRVEPGEIEAALREMEGVRDAVVLPRADASGQTRLVAWVVPAEAESVDVASLRTRLGERMPPYMVPAAFAVIPRIPVTAGGKVDRRALPDPELESGAYVAPRTPTEEVVAAIWSALLEVERVGVDDGFFELGGHSLIATRLVSRVREAFGVQLPIRAVFESPVLGAFAARVDEALRAGEAASVPPLVPVSREADLPLSYGQERLWVMDRLNPGALAYNVVNPIVLSADVDARVLKAALDEIVRRHEALRTVFRATEAGPVQVVAPSLAVDLPEEEMRGRPMEEQSRTVRQAVAHAIATPFDLERGPLLRARLLRGDAGALLIVAMHHTVSDGWSMTVFNRELRALYEAFERGEPSPLAGLPVQYADWAAWQRRWMESGGADAQVGYWKETLAGAPATLDLPADRPRPAARTHAGAQRWFHLPAPLVRRAREMADREGATLFMVLLAAFDVLLARLSGTDDVVVGTQVAGRTQPEAEGVIGFFLNNLALRADLSGDPSFRDVVGRVRRTALDAYAHQEVPFQHLLDALGVERTLSHPPLFQVSFVLQTTGFETTPTFAEGDGDAPKLPAEPVEQPAEYELTFDLRETPAGIVGVAAYSTERFDHATAARFVEHYHRLLDALLAEPEAPVSAPALADEEDRKLVLGTWNETSASFTPEPSVHALIARRAAEAPESVAAVFGEASLAYGALDDHAGRLAAYLRSLGVTAETRVAVAMERGMELPVALLAVLKAGAAYVPVDPAYPEDRIEWMLSDSGATVVLTQARVADRLPLTRAEIVAVDSAWERIAAMEPVSAEVDSANAAYVIYTSGSTGKPKGVVIPHASLLNHNRAVVRRYGLTPADRVLQFASLSFDKSVEEIFGTWAAGAAIVLRPDEVPAGAEFSRWVAEMGITVLNPPTAFWNEWVRDLDEAGETVPACVRLCIFGGEKARADAVAAWRRVGRGVPLLNGYGPTEITVTATLHQVRADADPRAEVPIGRPLSNVRVYVLDPSMRPVPPGVPGELFVGGAGLARGYLDRPSLTAEKFVPDPFSAQPGARLYRTGDRARWLGNGELEFLGRVDAQVKVRGFRIEPGEIEIALREHADVRDAVVIAREEPNAPARLVAYVVPADGESLDVAEMRAHLSGRLPSYMMPSAFVALDRIPVAAGGKVDRRALPAPDWGEAGAEYVAPRTRTEAVLAAAWADLLQVERVGVHDRFFDLGGHSLLATRVVSRVRAELGIELPVRAVFEHPTLAALAAEVDRLAGTQEGSGAPIRRGTENDLPLSFAQERLWFIDRLEPGSALYNMPFAVRLRGALDASALERALGEMVRRHEVLRTRFPLVGGAPVQHVEPADGFHLPVDDLSSLTTIEVGEEIVRKAREDAATPFDLAAGPLFRARLLRAAEDDHALLVNLHHSVSDGWSTGIFWRELITLYGAFSRGEASPLPELPVRYADYAAWQREWLSGERLAAQAAWWREHLAGAPAVLELPTDRPRPPVQSHRGADAPFSLPADTAEALRALAAREGATPFMLMLAAWSVLLARWSGQDDVVVGTPVAGRTRAEVEGLIGFFVNNLAIRTEVDEDASFRALLARVREATLGAFAHQDLPFERLVEELAPERSLSHAPVFQVQLVMENTPDGPAAGFPGVEMSGVRAGGGGEQQAKFDLVLSVADRADGGMRGALSYASDLWDAATMERMSAHLSTLLAAVAQSPDAPVSGLEMLGADERAAIVAAASATEAHPVARTIPDLFAEQAARTPDAVALTLGGRAMTYRELDARANRLANHLQKLGAWPDGLVGLCVERSMETVVGILAIVKAGAGYLPLDPAYPEDRLAYMVEDSGVSIVVTTSELADRFRSDSTTVVRLDADAAAIDAESSEAPEHGARPESLAYVIYTSGSTGKPKGVQVTHANVVRLFTATDRWFGFGASDVWTLFHSYAFDFSVWEIWGALLYGGRLVVVPFDVSRSPEEFYALLEAEGVTVLNQTPSAFRQLMRADEEAASRGAMRDLALRYVVFGGEALDPATLRGWVERRGDDRPWLVNMYGITETTVHVTYRVIREADVAGGSSSPIGVPIPDLSVHLLDRRGRLVPTGVVGEMYVGGGGVARGYLHRPELTAQRFVRDPFSAGETARLYRSGDLARRLADGSLEFHGRADDQVKVRGFRIELGEIESVLLDHPQVREAVVLTRGEGEAKRLVAWVVASPGSDVSTADLRAHLGGHLPDYMVPSAFVLMDALPLTRNGKVDRRALPEPEGAGLDGAEYVAPRTPTEEVLAAVWADLLGAARVGAEDGFFELGGHSLLATRVASRVREELRVELPVRAVFEHPTLGALAAEIDRLRRAAEGVEAMPIVPVPRDGGDLPLSFAQERMWFVDRMEGGGATYHMPMALRVRGRLDEGALRRALDALVRRHESLRTVFPLVDGLPVQRVLPPAPAAFTVHDLSALREDERADESARLVRENAVVPFSLEAGPLFRVDLVRLAEEEHLFLLDIHHIVSDGWSLDVLWRELGTLYGAFTRGEPSPLPPSKVQYGDFSAWQRGWLKGAVLERELGYWRSTLAGAPPRLELPTDRPRPEVQTHRGATDGIFFPRESADEVLALARAEGATLFMVLLAALDLVFSRLSGQDDVVVGTPIAGRTRAETEGMIGLFLNSLALRVRVDGDPTFRQLLARVREATLEAYAHQDVPFERILEEVQPERSLGHNPVFQVMLNLANFGDAATNLALPGLELRGLSGDDTLASKFDLTLYAGERTDGLGMHLVYNPDLFDADRARAMLSQLAAVLGQAAEDPDRALSSFSLAAEGVVAADAHRAVRTAAGLPAGVGEPGEVWEMADGEWKPTGTHGRLRPDGAIDLLAATVDADSAAAEPTSDEGGETAVESGDVGEEMLAIWREVLNEPDVQPDDDFFDLGGHSLLGVRLLALVKKRLGRTLALPALFANPTPARLAAEVESAAKGKAYQHLVPLQAEGELEPLFCVHPAGGTVFCYLPLVEALGTERPVYGVQAAGVVDGEPLRTVDQMAERYLDEVRRLQPHGPYHVCGWSAGGVIALEMAYRLRAAGEEVAFVGLFDTLPPDAETPIPDPVDLYRRLASGLSEAADDELDALVAELRELPIDDRLPHLATWLSSRTSEERLGELEGLRHVVEVFRANIGASRRHVLAPYPGRMTVFCAEWARGEGWEAAGLPELWRPHVAEGGELVIEVVPGTHASMVRAPFVLGLAEAIRESLGSPVPT